MNFCSLNKLHEKRRPIRHTFILRGLNSLVQKEENPRVFKEQYDQFIFQNTQFERGMRSYAVDHPHYLPIPFPRILSKELIS